MSDSNGTIPPAIPADREAERAMLERAIARTDLTEREVDDLREQIRAVYAGDTEWQKRVERALSLLTNRIETVYWFVVRHRALVPALASFVGSFLAVLFAATIAYWHYGERVEAVLKILAKR